MYPCATFHSLDGLSWKLEDETFMEGLLRIGGDEILEDAAISSEFYSATLSDTASRNREAYRELVRRQEEERWLNYVNYGSGTLQGDERFKTRERIKFELFKSDIEKPIEQRADERELRAARVQQWSIYETSKA
jgi:hypothetical protein